MNNLNTIKQKVHSLHYHLIFRYSYTYMSMLLILSLNTTTNMHKFAESSNPRSLHSAKTCMHLQHLHNFVETNCNIKFPLKFFIPIGIIVQNITHAHKYIVSIHISTLIGYVANMQRQKDEICRNLMNECFEFNNSQINIFVVFSVMGRERNVRERRLRGYFPVGYKTNKTLCFIVPSY